MKYRVLIPMARTAQGFAVGDLIEIADKAEAERMIAAGIIAPIEREMRVETADIKSSAVEKTVKASSPHKAGAGKKG